jgi:hypothetical protein
MLAIPEDSTKRGMLVISLGDFLTLKSFLVYLADSSLTSHSLIFEKEEPLSEGHPSEFCYLKISLNLCTGSKLDLRNGDPSTILQIFFFSRTILQIINSSGSDFIQSCQL